MIPAKPRQELKGLEAAVKLRVCAYCRVSTDNEDQLSSYEAQVEHAFSGKLFCQNCGSKFRRASWGTGKNKQYVWRCINREQNGVDKCSAKTIKEKALEQVFLRVMNLDKFDEEIFRRLIEKVKVQSMVEAVFMFKTGVECLGFCTQLANRLYLYLYTDDWKLKAIAKHQAFSIIDVRSPKNLVQDGRIESQGQ